MRYNVASIFFASLAFVVFIVSLWGWLFFVMANDGTEVITAKKIEDRIIQSQEDYLQCAWNG
jgi:hypothetical protein